jgi:hypothetical protein
VTANIIVQPQSETVVSIGGNDIAPMVSYHYTQAVSSDTWEIAHNLGFYPNVTVVDSGLTMVEAEVQHITKSRLRVTFAAPLTGQAYLS